jgi:hypothetical protein
MIAANPFSLTARQSTLSDECFTVVPSPRQTGALSSQIYAERICRLGQRSQAGT